LQVLICTLKLLICIFRPISIFDQFRPDLDYARARDRACCSGRTKRHAHAVVIQVRTCLALPGSLTRQPCPAALPGSLARQTCPADLPGSLAYQPCRKVCKLFYGRRPHACSIAYFYSAGSLVQAFLAIKDTRRMLRYAARFLKHCKKI
jgi:hypothetical protein